MIESTDKLLKIVGIYFAPSYFFNSIEENNQEATITFHSGRNWEEIKFTSASFDEQESDTDHGSMYKQKLNMVMAGDDKTVQERFIELKFCRPVFKIEYDNEKSKVIGDTYNHCNVMIDYSSENFETKRSIVANRNSHATAPFIA